MSTEHGKWEMPKFIKVPTVMLVSEGNENLGTKKEYLKAEARINPFHISSYYPNQYGNEGDKHSCTAIICAGQHHYVDMEIEEFDELINNVEREMKFEVNKIE